jgi:hypothetical protein
VILLKDLSNLVNKRERANRNDLDAVVSSLMNNHGKLWCSCGVVQNWYTV